MDGLNSPQLDETAAGLIFRQATAAAERSDRRDKTGRQLVAAVEPVPGQPLWVRSLKDTVGRDTASEPAVLVRLVMRTDRAAAVPVRCLLRE